MKEIFDKKTKQVLTAGIILIIVFFGFLYKDGIRESLSTFYAVFRPIVYGLVIAFIINLPMRFFQKKIFSRFLSYDKHRMLILILSLVMSWILFFAIVTLILTVLIPELSRAISSIIENIPALINSLVDFLDGFRASQKLSDFIEANLSDFDVERISTSLTKIAEDFLFKEGNIFNKTGSIIGSVSSGVFALVIGFIFSIYVSLNKNDLARGATRLIFANFSKRVSRQIIYIAKLSYDSFARFLDTRLLSCLSLGVTTFIGMLILRLPMAGMIAVIMGAFDFIPYFGPVIATGIGMLLISIQSPAQALVFLVFILIIQQVQEQIFYPLVIGKRQGLPAIWIFVSVLLGGRLFGIFGMIAFMPLATVVYTLIEDNTRKKLSQKDISYEEIDAIKKKSYEEMRKEKIEKYEK